jgi:hypothetical protein
VLEIERGDRGLEHRSDDVAAPRDALELVLRDLARVVEQALSEPELLRDDGAAVARDDVRPDLREPSLRRVLEAVVDGARDRELEDAVAQELEPLVRLGADVRPGGVREDLLEPVLRQLGDQAAELARSAARVGRAATPGAR